MKIRIFLIAISFGLFISCGDIKNNEIKNETVIEENASIDTLDVLRTEASRLRAGGSIKTIELKTIAVIEYVKDYKEYKKLQAQSGLTEKDLLAYWESGDAIKKALVDGSVRLMRKLDFIKGTKITLPYKGKNYIIAVTQSELEKFINADMTKIRNDWNKTFSDPYVYSKTGRNNFFNKFGKIE